MGSLKKLVFEREGKSENPTTPPPLLPPLPEQGETQQQTQPTYDIGQESSPGHTGGRCDIPSPLFIPR